MMQSESHQSPDQMTDLLRLHSIQGLGDRRLIDLFQKFSDLKKIIRSLKQEGKWAPQINDEKVQIQIEYMRKKQIRLVPYHHSDYPVSLRNLYDPPAILYVRGNFTAWERPMLAIVGTRRFTEYGRRVVEELVPVLVQQGIVIVSGMALGIDAFAHRACLKAGGSTIAVLGSGVDVPSPGQNRYLYDEILEHQGMIVSEFAIGSEAAPYTFPQRNRIIAGLSLGVLVVEAGETSGALITSQHALEMGREVFAVPGNIFSRVSSGTNHLIQMGAKLVTKPEDIFEELAINTVTRQPRLSIIANLEGLEAEICELIYEQPVFVDQIIENLSHFSSQEILSTLTKLELNGILRQAEDGYVSLA